jgi:hypothetical protein
MERLPDSKTQEKLAKVFKAVISAGLVAPVFVSISACEKSKPVVEEAQATATIPTTIETTPTTETTPSTTVAPTTTEAAPIEYEGVIIPPIEGLRFNNQSGTFLAETGNPYGLEAGLKAGVFIKDAIEINGKMENSIALRPEVMEFLQMQQFKEKGKIFIPIPIDLYKVKGVKINEVESFQNMEGKADWAVGKYTSLVFNVPEMTDIYSFLTVKYTGDPRTGLGMTHSFFEPETDWYGFGFSIPDNMPKEKFTYEGFQRIDVASFEMWCLGAKIDDPLLDEKVKSAEFGFDTSTEIGNLLCKIVVLPNEDLTKQIFSGFGSIEIFLNLTQGKGDGGIENDLDTGENILLEINKNKVSILPAK